MAKPEPNARLALALHMARLNKGTRRGLHILKTWMQPFNATWEGRKPFELRKDDREPLYAAGDILLLEEWNEGQLCATGRSMLVLVTYKAEGGSWGLPAELCVMGIRILDREDHGNVEFP